MKTKKKRMTDRPPNCARCARRSICIKVCDRMEQYMHDVIPSDFGREYPIGFPDPDLVNMKVVRYNTFKIGKLNDKEKKALALRLVNIPNNEIAKLLGVKPGYIRHLIYVARQKLRQDSIMTDNGRETIRDDSWAKTNSGRRKSPKD